MPKQLSRVPSTSLGSKAAWFLARLLQVRAYVVGGFTLLAVFDANDFRTMAGETRFHATNAFFEHLVLVGAFVLAVWLAPPRPAIAADG